MDEFTVFLLLALPVTGLAGVVLVRRHRWLPAAGCSALGLILAWQLVHHAPLFSALVAAVAVGVGWVWWTRSASTVSRWGARSRRKSGVASTVDVLRRGSALAVRRRAGVVRPSLAGLPRAQRWRLPTREVGVPLCRVGFLHVWSTLENVICLFGGPRTGKTGWLAGRVLDAPGAVLVTSTRTDLYELTAGLRAGRGPVFVFNPVGLAGLPSTISFDPLSGCADPVTAAERATDLLAATSAPGAGGEREFWAGQARRVLAALLHAAALGGLGMRDVLRWVADPHAGHREVTSLMRRSPEPALALDAAQFLTTNDRTQTSITSTIMPALGWLASPPAAAAAARGTGFDVTELLRTQATVYLLGAEESHTAPLVTALTGHIARQARRIAAHQPAGRLDPPLMLALDEAALISPVPLDSWTADMGGRGVAIIAAFQSRAQVIARWGATGAAVILNNTASILVFGGTRDRDDLGYWATLAGDRDEGVCSFDDRGRAVSRTVRQVPVLSGAQLANLPPGRVVVFHRGLPPVIGRVRPAWRRRDVRAHQTTERRRTAAVVAQAETATRTAHPGANPAGVARPGPGGPGATPPATPAPPASAASAASTGSSGSAVPGGPGVTGLVQWEER